MNVTRLQGFQWFYEEMEVLPTFQRNTPASTFRAKVAGVQKELSSVHQPA
jgi:hypothetical protein